MFSDFEKDDVFVIAEVGQNHQGSLEKALEYIRIFAFEGADAIKFQTRDNKFLFDRNSYKAAYDSENAFASTYGEHRECLELTKDDVIILKKSCEEHGVKFMSTPFDEPSLEFLAGIGTEVLKVASFDIGNIPFLTKIARTKIPTVMSIGGGNDEQINKSVEVFRKEHTELALLHCVSEYPCPVENLGLSNIPKLINNYKYPLIGSSDHFNGTLSGPIAYMLGARVFEKHVTLNRSWTGTDHSFALEPDGFRRFVRDIRRVKNMMPTKAKEELGNEFVFKKLGKSICASKNLNIGDILSVENMSGKIYQDKGVPVRESANFLGKKVIVNIKAGEKIRYEDIQ